MIRGSQSGEFFLLGKQPSTTLINLRNIFKVQEKAGLGRLGGERRGARQARGPSVAARHAKGPVVAGVLGFLGPIFLTNLSQGY